MLRTTLALASLTALTFTACKKDHDAADVVSLSASTTQAAIGQQVAVTLTTNATTSHWTVSPSLNATQAYGTTTNKVNYFTFSATGVYTVAVKVRSDDERNANPLDSSWINNNSRGRCNKGADTASIQITVLK